MTTPQKPIGSGFNNRSTATEVIGGRDLSGTTAIVTGGYSGLGLETVKALLIAGADVVVPARNLEKAEHALYRVIDEAEEAGVEVEGGLIVGEMDLSDPESVDAFVASFLDTNQPLHILINNAAIMANPLTRDPKSHESQFATNHLGHMRLTLGLWPALAAAKGARVVSLSSIGHARSPIVFEDVHFHAREYEKWSAYGQAKTANSLFAVELDRRGKDHGVRAFAVHPGGIMTELQRHLPKEEMIAMGWMDDEGNINPLFKSPEQGAATSVWAATSPQLEGMGGVYCEDCDIAQLAGPDSPRFGCVRDYAVDAEIAKRLWTASEAMLGITSPV
jgi:NAD(P)-dependent dehydrogenase (short-subunit alcohol dehydrogenase family)